jgi:hydrogenase-4 component E
LLPLTIFAGGSYLRTAVFGMVVIALKGFAFPRLLLRALRESGTNREITPFVGYPLSLVFAVLSLLAALWFDRQLALPMHSASDAVVPVAFSIMMNGLFLLVTRKTAVNQVIGYLMLENGIYALGLAVARDFPVLIELGVLLDLFVAVFVMGIAIYHLNREFDHIDSDRLTLLKG